MGLILLGGGGGVCGTEQTSDHFYEMIQKAMLLPFLFSDGVDDDHNFLTRRPRVIGRDEPQVDGQPRADPRDLPFIISNAHQQCTYYDRVELARFFTPSFRLS